MGPLSVSEASDKVNAPDEKGKVFGSIECNAFSFLGLEPRLDLQEEELEQRYEAAQKRIHPDQWGGTLVKSLCQSLSAKITHAYQILKDPMSRAEQIMTLKGYLPSPPFLDLMEDFLALTEVGIPKTARDQAYEVLLHALQSTDNQETIQRAYWWFLYLCKGTRFGK